MAVRGEATPREEEKGVMALLFPGFGAHTVSGEEPEPTTVQRGARTHGLPEG